LVDDAATYAESAATILADARAFGQKPVVFGPEGSPTLIELEPMAAIAADPHVKFLDRGPLAPETMFAMFREQSAVARAEGYDGLRVVADMDWLLSGQPTMESIVGFELLLDRVVAELDATVVCAYRRSSFDTASLAGALAVHPVAVPADDSAQFRFVAGDGQEWRLSGELDLAVDPMFAAAFRAAASQPACVVDISELEFIDVAGMRVIAEVGREAHSLQLRGASSVLRRVWQLTGFEEFAPMVQLV
jgi:anti-anti-sigma factor